MKESRLFWATCFLAAIIPWAQTTQQMKICPSFSENWPSTFQGKPVSPIAFSAREKRFLQDFPGQMAKFSDGEREILIRRVDTPTRKLHPSWHCFRGYGFDITAQPLWRDENGQLWNCFLAHKKGHEQLLVKERIVDSLGHSWPDVSAWYWDSIWGRTQGPWQAFTIAEP
jgi:hypothetical protein